MGKAKKKYIIALFYIAILSLITIYIINKYWNTFDNILPDELISKGYKYIIFGSQRTNTIELYDLKKGSFIELLPPNKDIDSRFLEPVIGISGIGYCIKEKSRFNIKNKVGELITFSLQTLKYRRIDTVNIFNTYANLALSDNEQKLAFIFSHNLQSIPVLGILDTTDEIIKENISIDKRFLKNPIQLIWKPDNKNIVIWDTLSGLPAVEINTFTGESKIIDYYPFDYYKDQYILVSGAHKENICLFDLKQNKKHRICYAGHTMKFSRDGKYFVSGRGRGIGSFETLEIIDIMDFKKRFQVKMDDHPSTSLGLDIW
ncbi:MAG: hypothetical protein ACMUJM_26000 [bacterium]